LTFRTDGPKTLAMTELTPRAVCELWPSLDALAADTGASLFAVRKWHNRKRVPAEWWTAVVTAAEGRGFKNVTLEALASMHARPATNEPLCEARA
jgi:hypothetical protein